MLKKTLALGTAALLVFTLSACGNKRPRTDCLQIKDIEIDLANGKEVKFDSLGRFKVGNYVYIAGNTIQPC